MKDEIADLEEKLEMLADEEYDKKWADEKKYKSGKTYDDSRFGKITVMKSKTDSNILFMKDKMVNSKIEATDDIKNLKNRMKLNNVYMINMVDYSS